MDQLEKNLVAVLSSLLYRKPIGEASEETAFMAFGDADSDREILSEQDRQVLADLVKTALRNGLVLDELGRSEMDIDWPTSGNTARAVVFARQPVRFAVKFQDDAKLVREARLLQATKLRPDLPQRLRDALPVVYAIKDDKEPYAYILEHFNSHLELAKVLFDHETDRTTQQRLVSAVLDLLFEAYAASADRPRFPLLPDTRQIYVTRITERLDETRKHDELFEKLFALPLQINGDCIDSCAVQVQWLTQNWTTLRDLLSAPLTTFVHGDSHPENIFVKFDLSRVDIKLIDPKDWGEGDYLFDICKLTHFLDVTGPLEKTEGLQSFAIKEESSKITLDYTLVRPPWIELLIEDVRNRVAAFAAKPNVRDHHWEVRYALSMGANILGLPARRVRSGHRDHAIVMLAEGALWLARLRRLTQNFLARVAK